MANIIRRRQPFLLNDLQEEINRLFDFSLPTRQKARLPEMGDWIPEIDIKDETDHYLIRADVPGVDPKDIEVTMENGMLTIKGKKEAETEEKTDNFVRVERSKGIFYRQFTLPDTADSEKIKAKTRNGVLEIFIPKSKKSATRKITVES